MRHGRQVWHVAPVQGDARSRRCAQRRKSPPTDLLSRRQASNRWGPRQCCTTTPTAHSSACSDLGLVKTHEPLPTSKSASLVPLLQQETSGGYRDCANVSTQLPHACSEFCATASMASAHQMLREAVCCAIDKGKHLHTVWTSSCAG